LKIIMRSLKAAQQIVKGLDRGDVLRLQADAPVKNTGKIMQSKRWLRKRQDRDYASTVDPRLVVREYLCRYRLVPSLKSRGERVTFPFKIREILFG